MLTAPMIDPLLCSLVDELDQNKLGIHSLDVKYEDEKFHQCIQLGV
jgi:hypothetical protein